MKKSICIAALSLCSTGITTAQTTDPAPYCQPNYKQPAATDDKIHTIKHLEGNFTHTASSFFQNSQYAFYNNLPPVVLEADSRNLFEITGQKSTLELSVFFWADTERDNDLLDQHKLLGERYQIRENNWVCTLEINIPADIDTGLMRVRIASHHYNHGISVTPCPTGYQNSMSPELGETRDFMVRIVPKGQGSTRIADVAAGKQPQLDLYPNPVRDRLYIRTHNDNRPLRAYVSDLTGRTLLTTLLAEDRSIRVADLPPGVYLITLSDQHVPVCAPQKFVVQ